MLRRTLVVRNLEQHILSHLYDIFIMIEVRLYKSYLKSIQLLLLSLCFVALGLFLSTKPDSKWIGWSGTIFGAIGLLVSVFHLVDRRPQIIINEIGIFDRTTHKDLINWEIIKDAYLVNLHGQKFICLIVNEEFEPSKKKGNFLKKTARFSKSLGFQELNISLGQIKINENRLCEFIISMTKANTSTRNEIIQKMLAG